MIYCSTVPGMVTGVVLMCEVMDDLFNLCTVNWDVSDIRTYIIIIIRNL